MKKWLIFTLLLLGGLACFPLWLPALGTFLTVPDQEVPADSLFVLRGEDFFNFPKAIDLYRRGMSPEIVFSPVPEREEAWKDYYYFKCIIMGGQLLSPLDYARKAFQYFGKDEKDLYFTEEQVASTFDEALAAKRWMVSHNRKSFILVASTYHMRRALLTFRKVFKGTGIQIYPVTAQQPLHDPPNWWRRERDVRRVLEEYVSLVFNYIHRFLLRQPSSTFDTF